MAQRRYVQVAPFVEEAAHIVGLPPGSYDVALVPRGEEEDLDGAVLEDARAVARRVELPRGARETVVWAAKE